MNPAAPPKTAPAPLRAPRLMAYALGAGGLTLAAASDTIAVAGRHLGLHLLGSIELTQTGIVFLGAGAMLYATLEGHHASVHMLTSQLRPSTAQMLARVMAVVSACVFLAIAVGSFQVASDLWHGFEETELLRIPIRWLRALWLVASLAIALIFLRAALTATSTSNTDGGEA
jgi:TRAP-type C4-dicarboxylate transport system permease small subunit